MQKNKGFTIVELVIAIPIIVIVIVVILGFLLTLLQDFSVQRSRQTLNVAGQTALQQIESDVKLSSAFLTAVDTATFTDNYGPSNSKTSGNSANLWNIQGGGTASRALILKTYATDKNPLADIRSPIYINQVGCSATQLYANEVLSNTVIYFILNNSLYRRVLTPATTPSLCNPPAFQVQTCPAVTGRPTNCIIDDTELLTNVSSFTVSYYISSVSPGEVTDAYTSSSSTVLDNVMAVEINVTHAQKATPPITNSAKLRVTRLN